MDAADAPSRTLDGIALTGRNAGGEAVVCRTAAEGIESVWRQFHGCEFVACREILNIEKPAFVGMAVSPDGRRLLFSQLDREESDLMLVDNFK